jgi:hypothetical protein
MKTAAVLSGRYTAAAAATTVIAVVLYLEPQRM